MLHIKVVLLDGERHAIPVAHHALLISDDPPSLPPRRVLTGADGTVDVRLRPGKYAIESDRPVAFRALRPVGQAGEVDPVQLAAEGASRHGRSRLCVLRHGGSWNRVLFS